MKLERITFDPQVMDGRPCLEREDLREALTFAAWRVEEIDVPVHSGKFIPEQFQQK